VFLSLLAEIPRIAAVLGFNQETGAPCPAIVKQDARFLALDRDGFPYHWEPPTKIKGRKDAADNASTPSEDGTAPELASELEQSSELPSSYEEGSEADVELEGQWEREQGGASSKAEIPPAESPAKLDVGKAKKKLPTVAQRIAASEPTKPLTPPRIGPSADALNSEKEWNPKIPKLLRNLSLVTKRVGTKGISYDQLEIILPAAKIFCSDYKQLRVRWDDNDIAIPGPCHSIPWETVEKAAKGISVFGANLVGALQAACAPSLERREIQSVFAEFTAMFDLNSVSYYTGEILNLVLEFAKKIPRSK
jgi:hypothetical protein